MPVPLPDASTRRVDAPRIARRDRELGVDDAVGQPLLQRLPGRAAVDRLEDAAVGAAPRAVLPRSLALLPHRRVDDVGVGGIDVDVLAAGVLVLEQHALERAAAVGRAEDAALLVRTVGMAERRHEQPVRRSSDRWRSSESAARRAGRDASTSSRRRWTCRCRRRRRGPGAAALRRCRRRRRWDPTARPTPSRSTRSAGRRRSASRCARRRSSSRRRRSPCRCRTCTAGWVRRRPPWSVPRDTARCCATASRRTGSGSPAAPAARARGRPASRENQSETDDRGETASGHRDILAKSMLSRVWPTPSGRLCADSAVQTTQTIARAADVAQVRRPRVAVPDPLQQRHGVGQRQHARHRLQRRAAARRSGRTARTDRASDTG